MTDLATTLPAETDHDLQTRRRNAMRIRTREPETSLGIEAALRLTLLEAEFDRRSLPGMIEGFLEVFPGGFGHLAHIEQERTYEVEASTFCRNTLTPHAFSELAS